MNTTRCLIGCSLGDLSTMYYLMTYHASMNAATSMSISSEYILDHAVVARDLPTDTRVSSDRGHKHFDFA